MIVGRVIELWRYPVKSLLGERLDRAWVGPEGVEGDRGFALRNAETGRVMSAKRYARLLEAHGRTDGRAVTIVLPTGDELDAEDAETPGLVGAWLGTAVEVVRPSGGPERPVIESEDGTFRGRAGGFFDSSAIHFVTTSTLEELGGFDRRRFRPNVVLETLEPGFVEEEWVGAMLRIGSAEVEITKPCSRCIMTTHAQEDLLVERDVLRTVNERNDGNAGVYGIVRTPGTISLGDEAVLP